MKLANRRSSYSIIRRSKRSDDEGSISSTFTAEPAKKVDLLPTKTTRVGFDMSKTIIHQLPAVTKEEVKERWFSAVHYKFFKHSLIDLARQFQHSDSQNPDENSFCPLLTRTFQACCDAQEDSLSSCPVDPNDKAILKQWFDRGSRRGIERVCVQKVIADKATRRKRISLAVLYAQDEYRDIEPDQRADRLRQVSEQVSRPSRLFAWYIAM